MGQDYDVVRVVKIEIKNKIVLERVIFQVWVTCVLSDRRGRHSDTGIVTWNEGSVCRMREQTYLLSDMYNIYYKDTIQ